MNYKRGALSASAYFLKKDELLTVNLYYVDRLGDMLKTSLGPTGRSKILLDKETGEYVLSKDGADILKEVRTLHPAVRIIADAGLATKNESGDGSITASILGIELFKKAVKLIREGLHPSIIIEGYNEALRVALETIKNEVKPADCIDADVIFSFSRTYLTTKLDLNSSTHLSDIVTKLLIKRLPDITNYKTRILDTIIIKGRRGGSIEDSLLINGVLLHKSGVDLLMPKKIDNAMIAIVENDLGFKRPDSSVNFIFNKTSDVKKFYTTRWEIFYEILNKFLEVGANVVLCSGNISEELRRLFVQKKILAIRNVSANDLSIIKSATNALPVSNVKYLTAAHLGVCSVVKEIIVSALDRWTVFEGCANPNYNSILIRGVTEKIMEATSNAARNLIKTIILAINGAGLVPGGGGIEMRVADKLRSIAYKYGSKTQIAILSYADAVEEVVATLCNNCGIDAVSTIMKLRSAHRAGEMAGIDQFTRRIINPYEYKIFDAAHVKIQCFKSATEAAASLIRIDFGYFKERVKEQRKDVIPEPVKQVRAATESYIKSLKYKK